MRVLDHFNSFTTRVMVSLLTFVTLGIIVVSALAFGQIDANSQQNMAIRLDRAARAAASITTHRLAGTFSVERAEDGQPRLIRMAGEALPWKVDTATAFNDLVLEIGMTNQGAANFFVWNETTLAFDRFATTFRRPDGSMPPPMALGKDHPAYATIKAGQVFKGNVPVMGRLRYAYLTPIVSQVGTVAGIMAIDVGWLDELLASSDLLRQRLGLSALAIFMIVALGGALVLGWQLRPLKRLARFAHHIAEGGSERDVPFTRRPDEIGQLAIGLGRVAVLQDKMTALAYTDTVTGLGNRARFLVDLDRSLAGADRQAGSLALLMLDLDHFKQINDAFGHQAGDEMLRAMAQRLSKEIGADSLAARIGGDEFAIITPYRDLDELSDRCRKLLKALARPVTLAQAELQSRASIGIALLSVDAPCGEVAYRNADLALRHSKSDGRDRFTYFRPEFNDTARHTMKLARLLRQALDEDGLTVHFQPQVSARSQSLYGLEALARWPHPTRGFIPPSEFIPVAEGNGLIAELGIWVLNETCRTGRQWLDAGFDFPHVSVNVSAVQLWQPDFVNKVSECLSRNDFPGARLCLEVTESLFVNHSEERILTLLGRLRDLGVRLSLDDFGSGYSSLGYLNRLPLDEIKVDRSFVTDVDKDARKQRILRGVVALGRGLGLDIVVEGAETDGEVGFLRSIRCDAIQGYYFARPVAAVMVPLEVTRIMALHDTVAQQPSAEPTPQQPAKSAA